MTKLGILETYEDYYSLLYKIINEPKDNYLERNLLYGAQQCIETVGGAIWNCNLPQDSIYTYHSILDRTFVDAFRVYLTEYFVIKDGRNFTNPEKLIRSLPEITAHAIAVGMFVNVTPGEDDTVFIVTEPHGDQKYVAYEIIKAATQPTMYRLSIVPFESLEDYEPLSNYFNQN